MTYSYKKEILIDKEASKKKCIITKSMLTLVIIKKHLKDKNL